MKKLLSADYAAEVRQCFTLPESDFVSHYTNFVNDNISNNPDIFDRLKQVITWAWEGIKKDHAPVKRLVVGLMDGEKVVMIDPGEVVDPEKVVMIDPDEVWGLIDGKKVVLNDPEDMNYPTFRYNIANCIYPLVGKSFFNRQHAAILEIEFDRKITQILIDSVTPPVNLLPTPDSLMLNDVVKPERLAELMEKTKKYRNPLSGKWIIKPGKLARFLIDLHEFAYLKEDIGALTGKQKRAIAKNTFQVDLKRSLHNPANGHIFQ